jgi:hypothetical protein
MRQSECVPQYDVFVVKVRVGVGGDPGWEALGGFAGGLGDVAAGGVELGVVVWVLLVLLKGWWDGKAYIS